MDGERRAAGTGRLVSLVAWAVLLLGLWLWGRELTEGNLSGALSRAVLGEAPAAARDGSDAALPPPAAPLPGGAAPRTVELAALGVRAEVIERGLDADGGVAAPPYSRPGAVGWYADGPAPGGAGAAVLVGHVDTDAEPAVFHALGDAEPGEEVRVERADGSVAEFTVSDVEVVERADFEPERVYGPREAGAAELRLITCGGTFDRERGHYSANVVVSAYLTGSEPAPGHG